MSGQAAEILHGEDLHGRSALPLLACLRAPARVLFLLSPHEAIVVGSPLDRARFCRLPLDRLAALPFVDRAFDCVVIDADGASMGGPLRYLKHTAVAHELSRVMREHGDCLILTRLRRAPRHLTALGEYRFRLDSKAWASTMRAASLRARPIGRVAVNDRRVSEIFPTLDEGSGSSPVPAADYMLTSFRRQPPSGVPVLEQVLENIGRALGEPARARIDRFLVRKIGKTAIMASIGSRRLLIKLPRSPVAHARAGRNFRALELLHRSDVLDATERSLIPAPVLQERCDDYAYFAEEVLEGRELRESAIGFTSWEPGALQFITRLHLSTRQARVVDDVCFQARFASPVRRIQRAFAMRGDADPRIFDQIVTAMRVVIGEQLPFVWAHGDFALGNCLYDSSGRLSAVVDWELFSGEGLPLLDVLHCMPVADESSSHPRWQRFDKIAGLLEKDTDLGHVPELARYIAAVGVPPRAVPALLIMYWIDHVANRIEGRGSDSTWMQKRVLQPLAVLSSLTKPDALGQTGAGWHSVKLELTPCR